MKKRKIKKHIKKPPFCWSLKCQIFVVILILMEFGILFYNRAWSQNYNLTIQHIRDQAEKLTLEQELISKKISYYYDCLSNYLENQNNFKIAERVFLTTKNISFKNNKTNE